MSGILKSEGELGSEENQEPRNVEPKNKEGNRCHRAIDILGGDVVLDVDRVTVFGHGPHNPRD